MSFVLLFHYLLLNMFRMLVHPSSGACDLLWIYFMFCIALVRCVLVSRCGSAGVVWYPYAFWSLRTVRVLFRLRTARNLSVSKLACPKVDICTLWRRRSTSFVVNCRFKGVSNKPWQDGKTEGLVLAVGHSNLNPASPASTQHSNGS